MELNLPNLYVIIALVIVYKIAGFIICGLYPVYDKIKSFINNFKPPIVLTINQTLGERMKEYEEYSQDINEIEPNDAFLIRLDGKSFSKMTSGLDRPDELFSQAMLMTTKDLMNETHAVTAFVNSDEISLLFKPQETENATHMYGGRVFKLISTIAGYASTRFSTNFINLLKKSTDNKHAKYLNKCYSNNELNLKFHFDARLVYAENKHYEYLNYILWRQNDCARNYISTLAEKYFSKSSLKNVSTSKRIEMIQNKYKDFKFVPHLQYGWLIKRSIVNVVHRGNNCDRHILEAKSVSFKVTNNTTKLFLNKNWFDCNDDLTIIETKIDKKVEQ